MLSQRRLERSRLTSEEEQNTAARLGFDAGNGDGGRDVRAYVPGYYSRRFGLKSKDAGKKA
jgi:hypothetical protein